MASVSPSDTYHGSDLAFGIAALRYARDRRRARQVSTRKRLQGPSSQLTDRSLAKYAEVEPWLHAFSWMDETWVRRCADEVDAREIPPRSPIVGLPVGVKDVFDTAGIP